MSTRTSTPARSRPLFRADFATAMFRSTLAQADLFVNDDDRAAAHSVQRHANQAPARGTLA